MAKPTLPSEPIDVPNATPPVSNQPSFHHTNDAQTSSLSSTEHELSPDESVASPAVSTTQPQASFEPAAESFPSPALNSNQNNLSVIAEDDEMAEYSRTSVQMGRLDEFPSPPVHAPRKTQEIAETEQSLASNAAHEVEEQSNSLTGRPKSSQFTPEAEGTPAAIDPSQPHSPSPPYVPADTPVTQVAGPQPKASMESNHETLRPISPVSSRNVKQDVEMAAPLPERAPSLPTDVNVLDVAAVEVSSAPLSAFPSLPEPTMMLRKSTYAPRDPSMGNALIGATTPGAALGGKRTSWLKKAREVKALEMTGAKSTTQAPAPPSITPGHQTHTSVSALPPPVLKRKSGDIATLPGTTGLEEEERKAKVAKTENSVDVSSQIISQGGILDRLKKTVEGLGTQVGKSFNGASSIASALAEARAAAEAKVMERNQIEVDGHRENSNRESTTTTPPQSPPATKTATTTATFAPTGTVFNKPPPVFVPPSHTATTRPLPTPPATKSSAFNPPSAPTFSLSAHPTLSKAPVPLSAQSTLESIKSDAVFDEEDDVPAWVPSTQDTDYSMGYGSQSLHESQHQQQAPVLDEDDSWPIDEKLAAGVQWSFGASKEDSMTWSTLPSQSQRGTDTGHSNRAHTSPLLNHQVASTSRNIPGAFEDDMKDEDDLFERDEELEEIVLGPGKSTASPIESQTQSQSQAPRSQSQMSLASSASSQSQTGFFGQASKMISSALGTSKKAKPEVKKVLQMAAVAAKKQQEEADKKAARLKEMDNRRQLALQRKAEEEKAKAEEEERKLKEEGDRRKREREEQTDKRTIKAGGSKKDEDTSKKRKVEVEKKQELKKPAPTPNFKSQLKPAMKQPPALASSTGYNAGAPSATKPTDASKGVKAPSSLQKGKGNAKVVTNAPAIVDDDDVAQPSQKIQSLMAARVDAQLKQKAEPVVPSESIELPDINSEYSDSDDEDRPRTFDPPNWAQSPELRQALEMQSGINPDDIFGAVRPLKMEEIFKTKTSRFRARTSSANWTGSDRLTVEEEREYARRMGFR